MEEKPELFYRLKTKDGIVSDIRPLGEFVPRILLPCRPERLLAGFYGSTSDTPLTLEKRDYEMVKHRTVVLVDFEER